MIGSEAKQEATTLTGKADNFPILPEDCLLSFISKQIIIEKTKGVDTDGRTDDRSQRRTSNL